MLLSEAILIACMILTDTRPSGALPVDIALYKIECVESFTKCLGPHGVRYEIENDDYLQIIHCSAAWERLKEN